MADYHALANAAGGHRGPFGFGLAGLGSRGYGLPQQTVYSQQLEGEGTLASYTQFWLNCITVLLLLFNVGALVISGLALLLYPYWQTATLSASFLSAYALLAVQLVIFSST